MSWQTESLGTLLAPAGSARAGKLDLPVLSITMRDGLVDQSAKFKKRVASKDISGYRVVYTNELVVGFPIDEGVLGFQVKYPAAVVSPAYGIWKLRRPAETHIPFVERYLRSNEARTIYARKMRSAVDRRRTIAPEDFLEIEIPFPPVNEQRRIAAMLDKADALRRQRLESLQLAERLVQSIFIKMFGDPVENPKGWPTQPLGQFGAIQTGNTPPRSNKENYAPDGLEWIKTDNIVEDQIYVTRAVERLSATGAKIARIAPADSLLVACIAGSEKSIGRAALTNRSIAFNQQINTITPHAGTSPLFLYFLIKVGRRHIQLAAGKGMKKMINKSTFQNLNFIAPGEEDQRRFEILAQSVIAQSQEQRDQLPHLDALFSSIQQRAFRGELDLSRLSLDRQDDLLESLESQEAAARVDEPNAAVPFLQAPEGTEAALQELDASLHKDGPIQWSADYFRYRVLGTMPIPFSFDEVMQRIDGVFNDAPPYEEIKDIFLELLGQGAGPGLLKQKFDLQVHPETSEVSGRKEIVFEPTT